MSIIKRSFLLAITLLVFGSGIPNCHKQSPVKPLDLTPPNFPFTIVDELGSIVFIAPEYYSQKNLHDLFLWHYQKGLRTRTAPDVRVFTDKRLLDAYLEDRRKGFREYEPKAANPTPLASPHYYPRRIYSSDAEFSQVPSESSLDPNKGDDISSRGYNVTYSFAPDLNQPDMLKEVVLRGSTWRQGKYNLQTQEFPWRTGNITLMAYDIYNVEPSGRYYTYTVPRRIGEYKTTAIIFNILLNGETSFNPNQVKILNDKVAYVYLGWMYSVSLDGGQTWHLWDAERNLLEWKCCDSSLIRDVNISDQGNGVMTLRPDPNKPENQIYLRTTDFGQHWVRN